MNLYEIEKLMNLKPEFFISLGQTLINIFIIVIIGTILLRLIHRTLTALERKHAHSSPFVVITNSMLRWAIYIGSILLILQQMGITLNSIWTVISAIVAMIAIGFVAVWSVLSNLLCTIMLIIFHPFRIGDEIEVIDPAMKEGVSGRVRNINLMFTSLYESAGSSGETVEIRVPNNLFFQKIIRCRKGKQRISLDKQLFEEESFLRSENTGSVKS